MIYYSFNQCYWLLQLLPIVQLSFLSLNEYTIQEYSGKDSFCKKLSEQDIDFYMASFDIQ